MTERLRAFWFPPAPAERLAMLRILIGAFALVYLLVRSPSLVSVTEFRAEEFHPVGLVSLLSVPLSPAWVHLGMWVAVASAVAFAFGVAFRISGPLLALLFLWVTSYRSSWGMIFHTDNLLAIHLLLLGISPAADALSWDSRFRAHLPAQEHGRYGWAIRAMGLVIVITYSLAGIAKLKLSGTAWLEGELLRAHIAYDNLRKIELGSGHSALGAWLVRHPAVFPPLALATILVELGAPLALWQRRAALIWSLAAWGFHLNVALLMNIAFPYPLSFVAFAPLFRVEALLELARRRGGAMIRALGPAR